MGIVFMCAGLAAADPGTGAPGFTASFLDAGFRSDDVIPVPPTPGSAATHRPSRGSLSMGMSL